MTVTLCQVAGFVLSVLGVGGVIVATAIDQWSTEDRYSNPVTAVYSYYGLWRSCVTMSSGFIECRPYFTILGLPGLFQAVRALMIVGIVIGVIGAFIALFSLKCLKMGSTDGKAKAGMTLTSGIMFAIAGVCSIAGVSIFANLIVTTFMLNTYSPFLGLSGLDSGALGAPLAPRYTFGAALFIGWVAGGVLIVGGIMMCLACRGLMPEEEDRYKAVSYKAPSHPSNYGTEYRSRQAYEGPYKGDSRRSNQRFDYV